MRLTTFIRNIYNRYTSPETLITVHVSRSALIHNLKTYRNAYPTMLFAPVLKSNAYGHGLITVAEILKNEPVAFFVLDSFYEALLLRQHGIRTPILIIGYTSISNIVRSKLRDVAFTITSLEQLRTLGLSAKKRITIHLKIDTGMHRQGLLPTEVGESIALIHAYPNLHVEGICSHLGDADNRDVAFTKKQIRVWEQVVHTYKNELSTIRFYHIAATAGTAHATTTGNLARLGLGLYGINPSPHTNLILRPALRMETVVSSIRTIGTDESVGYNHTYTLTKPALIASIPAGYYEGIDRRLSSNGYVQVREALCPIVGRVSMNITSIDVSGVQECSIGDPVTLISDVLLEENSVASIARRANTIPWEILVHIPSHLRRVVVD